MKAQGTGVYKAFATEEAEPETKPKPKRECTRCGSTDLEKETISRPRNLNEPDSISTIPVGEPRYVCNSCGKEIPIKEDS